MNNQTYDKVFSSENKAVAFDRIAEHYFQRNFGTMSKSDLETLLFDIYLERLLDKQENFDDYTMSKQLGITQSRVRTLKVRKELQYPRQGFKWEEAFVESICKATYDEQTKSVEVPIPDVNVLAELRYYMECRGWFDEYRLNPKLFQCRIGFFLELCKSLSNEEIIVSDEAKSKLRELNSANKGKFATAIQEIVSGSVKEGLKDLTLSASKEVVLEVLKLIPFGGLAGQAISALETVIENA